MNSNKQTFSLKTLQSKLRELKLYTSLIDGSWGGGCKTAFEKILITFKPGHKVTTVINSYDAKAVFIALQTEMAEVGVYTSKIDGLWGENSFKAFYALCDHYVSVNKLPVYDFAWTAHPNVPADGVLKIKKWLNSKGKPDNHVSYLLSCFALETIRTFNPAIVQKDTKAVGLIQFMPKTAKQDLGTTTDYLKTLSFVDQLDWVFKYFEQYGYINKCKYLEDYYLSIFMPARMGRDPDEVVASAPSITYTQNQGFDKSKRGFYTVGDIASAINSFYFDGMSPKNRLIK